MRQQRCEAGSERARRDWVGDRKMYMALWGVPDIALLAGIFLPPAARTVVWATALFWKVRPASEMRGTVAARIASLLAPSSSLWPSW
jgi:hypothetical protein